MSLFSKVGLPPEREPVTGVLPFGRVWYSWLMKATKAALAKGDYGIGLVSGISATQDIDAAGAYVVNSSGGAVTVTLKTSICQAGNVVIVKRVGANTVTIDTEGAETIDGGASLALTVTYMSYTLTSDGTNWYII